MTRKDYIKIADIIKDNKDTVSSRLVADFVSLFKEDNNRFDENRFINYINENNRNRR